MELLDRYTVSRWTEVQMIEGIDELNAEMDYWIGGQMNKRELTNLEKRIAVFVLR